MKDRALSDSTHTKPMAESPLEVWGLWQAPQGRAVCLPQVIHEAGIFLHLVGCGQASMQMQAKFRTGAGTGQVQALPLPSLERGWAGAHSLAWIISQAETVKALALKRSQALQ